MKTPRLLLLHSVLLAALVAPLAAQPAPAAASKPPAPTRVACVKSDEFLDENNGIKKLVKALKDMDAQFQPQQTELMTLNDKFRTLAQEVQQLRANPAADPKVVSAKIAEAQQIQRTIKAKGEEGQAAYNKRSAEVKGPVDAEIFKDLTIYREERGIDLLLDSSKLGPAMLSSKPELDLTNDFIAWFNARHP